MSQVFTFAKRDDMNAALAAAVATELTAAISTRGKAVLAVPGGTTPAPFFGLLAQIDLDWSKVTVMLTDERFVPESSDRSNTRLIKETLLAGPPSASQFVPFYASAEEPEEVLADIQSGVADHLPLDVCVLGMGTDMHTASIFPGADLLDQALALDAPCVLPMRAAGAPEPRLTLTAPVLQSARNIHVLITGAAKIEALDAARAAKSAQIAPIKVALDAPNPADIYYSE